MAWDLPRALQSVLSTLFGVIINGLPGGSNRDYIISLLQESLLLLLLLLLLSLSLLLLLLVTL